MNINPSRFALNRCIAPSAALVEFLDLAERAGIRKVELRNDLAAQHPIDGLEAGAAARLIANHGIEVVSINAVQKFNLTSARAEVLAEIDRLLDIAQRIHCPAIVLCPNCDPSDARSEARCAAETVDSLMACGPAFVAARVLGYVEPLGYSYSSLPSVAQAVSAIQKSGHSCYRVLIDSFHHFVGPEDDEVFRDNVAMTGLVHVSGVATVDAHQPLRDAYRGLVGPDDVIRTKEQLRRLLWLGYAGDISLEPYGYVGASMPSSLGDGCFNPSADSPLRLGYGGARPGAEGKHGIFGSIGRTVSGSIGMGMFTGV